MTTTCDRDVRQALLRKVIAEHVANPDTLVVEELGVERGAARIDVAVVNGHLHGYEIKSDRDTLNRLPRQVEAYGKVLDRATLVVSERHLDKSMQLIPEWWGVRTVSVGARGAVNIRPMRSAGANPGICLASLAMLLWNEELVALLSEFGIEGKALRGNRAALCDIAQKEIGASVLRSRVRECLKRRTGWRVA